MANGIAQPALDVTALDNPRTINGWAMYDWANSVYSLVITSSIFPIFFENSTPEYVEFFGRQFRNTALYSYSLSAAFLIVALISPLLSGIADYSGKKKQFMQVFCYLGALACTLLYFFSSDFLELGIFTVMLAAIGYSGSLVFYNAFLPEIASPLRQDAVSAKGYALGYIGSILLLVVNLAMIMQPGWFGLTDGSMPARISFVMVGLWWALFAQFAFNRLPDNVHRRKPTGNYLTQGYKELRGVFRQLRHTLRLKRFLAAFFVYNMGVQTVMYMAISFAKNEITDMPDSGLIVSILLIQIIAIAGAYLFAWLSEKFGNIKALAVATSIWIIVCYIAYSIHTPIQFYALAALVGGVMGGIQALSRSTYSKYLPPTVDTASYFSFYDISDKLGLVIGTVIFGLVFELTDNLRYSALALMGFFILCLMLLARIPRSDKNYADS